MTAATTRRTKAMNLYLENQVCEDSSPALNTGTEDSARDRNSGAAWTGAPFTGGTASPPVGFFCPTGRAGGTGPARVGAPHACPERSRMVSPFLRDVGTICDPGVTETPAPPDCAAAKA